MSGLDFLGRELEALGAQGLLRVPSSAAAAAGPGGGADGALDVTSNDYLGLGRRLVSRETLLALAPTPAGSGASRLIHGTHAHHEALEQSLAAWTSTEATLLFASGYAANAGTVSALAQDGDLIVSDALNHASLIDGCRLARAQLAVVPHLDLEAVRTALQRPARRRWILTESYFSMDGDSPDLPALRALADAHDAALLVDEAHALGVFGPQGAGLAAAHGVTPDVLVGTFGKALGTHGAFVAGSTLLRTYLWNRARSFVFSTAPIPLLAALTSQHLAHVRAADAARIRLHAAADRLRATLRAAGLTLPQGNHGPILPILLGEPAAALAAAERLRAAGIRAQPIRPPTVPPGTARLRITLNAALTDDDLRTLEQALLTACRP